MKLIKSGGIPIETPIQAIGKVIRLDWRLSVTEASGGRHERVVSVKIDFQFDTKPIAGLIAKQLFRNGDVYPGKIGDKMFGVATFNQWGSLHFIGTHLVR